MIRAGFLSPLERAELIALARDGSAAHRLARRANALVLLDDGLSCAEIAKVLFIDDDTIRRWRGLFIGDGLEGLARFDAGAMAFFLRTRSGAEGLCRGKLAPLSRRSSALFTRAARD